MSIEYEVRSDDEYSRPASAAKARAMLGERWGVNEGPAGVLLYDAERCLVEIELGSNEPMTENGSIQWVGLRVPAGARLESATRAIAIGMSLGQELDWRLYDPQSDRYVLPSDMEPGPPLRDALAQLAAEVRAESRSALARRLWLRGRRQSLRSIGEIAFGAVLVAFLSGWLFRLSPRATTRPYDRHHRRRDGARCRRGYRARRAGRDSCGGRRAGKDRYGRIKGLAQRVGTRHKVNPGADASLPRVSRWSVGARSSTGRSLLLASLCSST